MEQLIIIESRVSDGAFLSQLISKFNHWAAYQSLKLWTVTAPEVRTAYRQIVHLSTPAFPTARRDFTSSSLSKVLRFETMLHLPVFVRIVASRKSDTRKDLL
jgi:hypothetical protein